MISKPFNRLAIGALGILGFLQMIGDLSGLRVLKGLGAASAASPAPKVFCSAGGLETFSSRFVLEWRDPAGRRQSLPLSPALYRKLRGPYNRRNVYGAALAYGPVLPDELRDSVLANGWRSLVEELGMDPATLGHRPRIRVIPKYDSADLPLVFEVEQP